MHEAAPYRELSLWSPGGPAGAEHPVWVLGCTGGGEVSSSLGTPTVGGKCSPPSRGCLYNFFLRLQEPLSLTQWIEDLQVFLCGHLVRRQGQRLSYGCWGAGGILKPFSVITRWAGRGRNPRMGVGVPVGVFKSFSVVT